MIYFNVIAHPKTLKKEGANGYPCPDVYDIAGGGMWNNKCDNVLVYFRPEKHKDPLSPVSEIHVKKVKKQKAVGKPGVLQFNYVRRTRRFDIEDIALDTVNFDSREKSYVDFVNKISTKPKNEALDYIRNLPHPDSRIESKGKEEDFDYF